MPGSHYWVRIGQGRAVWQVHFVPCPVPIVRIGLTCDWNLEEESIVGFEIDVSSLKKGFFSFESRSRFTLSDQDRVGQGHFGITILSPVLSR